MFDRKLKNPWKCEKTWGHFVRDMSYEVSNEDVNMQ